MSQIQQSEIASLLARLDEDRPRAVAAPVASHAPPAPTAAAPSTRFAASGTDVSFV